jgi:alkylation response protein AidB-like acyl-CoA dehydrogenase
LHARRPAVGAGIAALAHHGLAEALERCRAGRLTRNQHVLLRLGELVATVEGAAALARRAARAADGELAEKADRRFTADGLAAVSRVNAREAALKVATEGMRLVVGAGGVAPADVAAFGAAIGLPALHGAQAGLLDDMDAVADALYGR